MKDKNINLTNEEEILLKQMHRFEKNKKKADRIIPKPIWFSDFYKGFF